MVVKYATAEDRAFVMSIDRHVSETAYHHRVYTKSGYVLWEQDKPVGLMVHCVLWDNLPFMNLIYVQEPYRNRGFGSQAIKFWEEDMKKQGYKMVLVSTRADESAQHLYRKLGYLDCGALLFHDTPMEQPMEIFLRKVL